MNSAWKITVTVVKLFLLSVMVGWIVRVLDLSISGFIENFGGIVAGVYRSLAELVGWTIPYALVGAIIVVPLWLMGVGLRALKRRNRDGRS